MGKVAVLYDGQFIYWRSILWAVAVVAALLMAVAIRLWQRKPLPPLLVALPAAIVLSVYCARIVHWYCRFEAYGSLRSALTDLGGGGFSLIGVFAGTLLALLLVRALQLTKELPSLLDAVSPAAAFGIAVGRWAEYFTAADRGKMILEGEAFHHLPWATEVVNAGGAVEWRFATFAFQSIWCAIVFAILLACMLIPARRQEAQRAWRDGNLFCTFVLLYCLGQIVLDSTRYDALFLRSNGFVSLVQIVCAVAVAAVTALYSVRSIRARGYHWYHGVLWGVAVLGLGLAGFMEWYVQRHGNQFVFAYAMMALGLAIFLFVPLWLRRSTRARMSEREDAETAHPLPVHPTLRKVASVAFS